jgi:hypothetical protein
MSFLSKDRNLVMEVALVRTSALIQWEQRGGPGCGGQKGSVTRQPKGRRGRRLVAGRARADSRRGGMTQAKEISRRGG